MTIRNDGDMAHGIDFHAGAVDPDGPMRSIDPGHSLTYQFTANYSGAWLYHCSTMPMSLHIANGMYGAVIIDPPDVDDVAQQFVLVQSELYIGAQNGTADEAKIDAKAPDAIMFNGYVDQYDHAPSRSPPAHAYECGWSTPGRNYRRRSMWWAPSSTRCSKKAPTCCGRATRNTVPRRP